MNKTKARSEHIRKRAKIEEKYSWDRMSDADDERQSHSTRAVIASIVVLTIFTLYLFKLYEVQVSSHEYYACLLYTSPSPRDLSTSRMPSSA